MCRPEQGGADFDSNAPFEQSYGQLPYFIPAETSSESSAGAVSRSSSGREEPFFLNFRRDVLQVCDFHCQLSWKSAAFRILLTYQEPHSKAVLPQFREKCVVWSRSQGIEGECVGELSILAAIIGECFPRFNSINRIAKRFCSKLW
jgi:hypothetical protein